MSINTKINTRLNLTIPRDLKKQLEELARLQNRSTTNLIITILKDYVNDTKSLK